MNSLTDQLRQSWTTNAEAWTEAVRSRSIASRETGTDAAIVEAVLNGLPPKGRVLDLGCGEGWLVRALEALGVEARGVDASAPLVEAARASGGRFDVLSYEQAEADPALLGSPVDAVVLNFALLSDRVAGVLRAAASRLDGGRVLIQTVHPATVAPPYRDGWREETFSPLVGDFQPMPWFFRTFGSWVRVLDAAGLTLTQAVEPLHPDADEPLSLILVAEPRA